MELDNSDVFYNQGNALANVGRYWEAIASYDQALQHKPNDESAWYNKACAYALQQQPDPAIEILSKAIALDSQKYRAMARTNTNFDSICTDPRFLTLLAEP